MSDPHHTANDHANPKPTPRDLPEGHFGVTVPIVEEDESHDHAP